MQPGRRGRVLRRRWVPALVWAVQLAAVTLVPFVHPLLHRTPDPGPTGAAMAPAPAVGGEFAAKQFCWACLAEAGIVSPAAIEVGRTAIEWCGTDIPHPTGGLPTRSFPRAHPVRGPPAR